MHHDKNHTYSNWHLDQTFFGYNRTDEHQAFQDWLTVQICQQQTDVLLIYGNLFDVANSSAQAQRQFYRFLQTITDQNPGLQMVIIAGNHDSAARREENAEVLEKLTGTEIYSVISYTVYNRTATLRTEWKALNERMSQIQMLSPEEAAELQKQLEELLQKEVQLQKSQITTDKI